MRKSIVSQPKTPGSPTSTGMADLAEIASVEMIGRRSHPIENALQAGTSGAGGLPTPGRR